MSVSKMSKPLPSIRVRLNNGVPGDQDAFSVNVAVVHGYVMKVFPSDGYKEFNFVNNELKQEVQFMVYRRADDKHIGCLFANLVYDDIKEGMTIASTNEMGLKEGFVFKLIQASSLDFDLQISKVAH